MTNEEAKDFLTHYICSCEHGTSPTDCDNAKCKFGMSIRTICDFERDFSDYCDKLWNVAYERGKNERPQGKWIKEDKLWGGFGDRVLVLTCSECGKSFIYRGNNPKFCSECGADMREADNDK